MKQIDDNLKAAALKLSDEQMKILDEASELEWGYLYGFIKNVQGRW